MEMTTESIVPMTTLHEHLEDLQSSLVSPRAFPRARRRLLAASCSHAGDGKAFPHQQLPFQDKRAENETYGADLAYRA